MFETVVLFLIYLVDWLLEFIGPGGYFLLLFPMFLYFRDYSAPGILLGGLLSGLLAEMIRGYFAGSLLVGLGVAIFVVQQTKTFIQWQLIVIRALGLLLFLALVFLVRAVVIFAIARVLVGPDLSALLVTFAGAVLILIAAKYSGRSAFFGAGR